MKIFLLFVSDLSQSVLITQWPQYISTPPNKMVEMQCYQNDTDYQYMYWYKQLRGTGFQLMVTIIAGTVKYEDEFETGFQAAMLTGKQWSLTIPYVQSKDEAVYLCAASLHSAVAAGTSVAKTSSTLIIK